MIDVRGIANRSIQPVNPNIPAIYYRNSGYTTTPSGKQVPAFDPGQGVIIQLQALKGSDLKHVENLNLQNVYRNVRMWGYTQGVVRVDSRGGDVILFPESPGDVNQTWLVSAVLENWPTWSSVIVCLQRDTFVDFLPGVP